MSIRNQDKLLIDAFTNMYVIEANIDSWGFPPDGKNFYIIPIFYALDENGKPAGLFWMEAHGEKIAH